MSAFRYGELFAGAGGLSQGLERAGMSCAFHAELADFPRRVLAHHWPDTPLYGDVTTLDGRELVKRHGPIDLLAGGSPCQDLSVAGKRAGIEGARSGLFYEQIRLWQETGATYLLWENVAGALSSNQYADFAAVLSAIVGGTVPVPSDGWASAGVVAGPAGVAAWRLLDAQWFGVPQRRLRVFVLGARAGGCDPAEVLLEPQGVRGNPPTRREARESTPCRAGDGAAVPLLEVGKRTGVSTTDTRAGSGIGDPGDPMFTLQASAQHGVLSWDDECNPGEEIIGTLPAKSNSGQSRAGVVSFGWQNSESQGDDVSQGSDAPLRTGTTPAVLAFDALNNAASGTAHTLRSNAGEATGYGGVLAYDTTQVTSAANRSNPRVGDTDHPLAARAHAPLVVSVTGEVTHSLTHEGHDASEDGTGRGTPIIIAPPLVPGDHAGSYNGMDVVPVAHAIQQAELANTITAREAKGWEPESAVGNGPVTHGIPRRLMPIECERLMGWDDNWTNVPDEKGKPASDSVRYKACGNGVVSSVAEWIGVRLVAVHTAMLADQERAA